jgi:predicted RNase H-like nuclease (RuvC/YqgF family)
MVLGIEKEHSMADKKSATMPQAEPMEDVNRIRDIIFGSQMKDYDERFDSLQRDLKRLEKELDGLSERLTNQDGEQNNKLQSLRRSMRRADRDLRDELRQKCKKLTDEKADREVLGQMFIELGTRLKTGGSLADLLQGLEEAGQD